jgi:hypothetical protein
MYPGVLAGLRQILATDGVRGLYVGFGSVCLRDVPFTMVELGLGRIAALHDRSPTPHHIH